MAVLSFVKHTARIFCQVILVSAMTDSCYCPIQFLSYVVVDLYINSILASLRNHNSGLEPAPSGLLAWQGHLKLMLFKERSKMFVRCYSLKSKRGQIQIIKKAATSKFQISSSKNQAGCLVLAQSDVYFLVGLLPSNCHTRRTRSWVWILAQSF